MKNCVSTKDIVYWTILGYAAYSIALYVWRKPVCRYVEKICDEVN